MRCDRVVVEIAGMPWRPCVHRWCRFGCAAGWHRKLRFRLTGAAEFAGEVSDSFCLIT